MQNLELEFWNLGIFGILELNYRGPWTVDRGPFLSIKSFIASKVSTFNAEVSVNFVVSISSPT